MPEVRSRLRDSGLHSITADSDVREGRRTSSAGTAHSFGFFGSGRPQQYPGDRVADDEAVISDFRILLHSGGSWEAFKHPSARAAPQTD